MTLAEYNQIQSFTFHYELIITKIIFKCDGKSLTFTFHYELIITIISDTMKKVYTDLHFTMN